MIRLSRRLAPALMLAVSVLLVTAATAGAAFPGQNGKIAFQTNRDGNFEVYAMEPDGSELTNLTNNAASDSLPAWSADGQRIAFTSTRDGDAEIYVMDADGSGPTRLTNNAAPDFDPAWSPDGQQIAFLRAIATATPRST